MSTKTFTISLKIDQSVKNLLTSRAKKKNQTTSKLIRNLIYNDLNISPKTPSPLLKLQGTMSEKEAEEILTEIKKTRFSK